MCSNIKWIFKDIFPNFPFRGLFSNSTCLFNVTEILERSIKHVNFKSTRSTSLYLCVILYFLQFAQIVKPNG